MHEPHADEAAPAPPPPQLTDLKTADIARVCHEANRSYCWALGDVSQPPWVQAPQWQKDSAIAGVKALLDSPAMSPEDQHMAWVEHKLAEGWSYGPVKDPEKKLHPCLVDYGRLPPDQRRKDALFQAVVRALADLS